MSDRKYKSAFTSKTTADQATAHQVYQARKATALHYRQKLESMDQENDAEELKNAVNARAQGGSQWWDTKDTVLSIGRGVSNFGRSAYNLFGSGFGKNAKDLGWEYKESKSISGGLVGGLTQFITGFATTKGITSLGREGLKAHAKKQLAKGKGAKVDKKFAGTEGASALTWARVMAQGTAYGAVADFISFDPDEGNLGTMLLEKGRKENWKEENPKFMAVVEDWVAIDPEEWAKNEQGLTDHFKERFKNVGEGVIMGVGIDAFMRLMKVTHISRNLKKAEKELVAAQGVLDDLVKGSSDLEALDKSSFWNDARIKYNKAQKHFDETITAAKAESVNIESTLNNINRINKQQGSGIGVIGDDIRVESTGKFKEWVETSNDPAAKAARDARFDPPEELRLRNKEAFDQFYAKEFKEWVETSDDPAAKALRGSKKWLDTLEGEAAGIDDAPIEAAFKVFKKFKAKDAEVKFWNPPNAVEVDFSTSSNAEVRTHLYRIDPNGTIGLDLKALRRDFQSDDPLPYLSGDVLNPVTGHPSSVSTNEAALLNGLGVDPARLKKQLIEKAGKEGAVEMYKDFFLFRSRNVKALGKDAGLAFNQLYMGSARADKVFKQATFDALFKPVGEGGLGLNPEDVRGVWAGEITPTGHKLDPSKLASRVFDTQGGIEAFISEIEKAKKGEITLHEIGEKGDLINPNTFTSDSGARDSLIALGKTNEDIFTSTFNHIDDLATALGWKGPTESLTAEDYVKKDIKDFLKVIQDSNEFDPPSMKALENQLAGGEGIFDGSGLEEINLGGKSIDDIDHVPLTKLSARILSLRQNLTGRLRALAERSEEFAKKLETGDLTDDDRLEFNFLKYGAERDLARIRLMSRAAGKALRSTQNYDKMLQGLSPKEQEVLKEQFLEAAGGRERIDEAIALSNQANKPEPAIGSKGILEQRLNAHSVVSEHGGADLFNALNDVWINALLSGPRTQSVNLVSNVIKGGLNIAEEFLGTFAPRLPFTTRSVFKGSKEILKAQDKQTIFGDSLKLTPKITKSDKGWTFMRTPTESSEIFSTKKQAIEAGEKFMSEKAAASSLKFTRGQALDQFTYATAMSWDILRIFFRNVSDGLEPDIVTGDLIAQQRGKEALDALHYGGQSDANITKSLGGTVSEALDESAKGAANSHQIMGAIKGIAKNNIPYGGDEAALKLINGVEGTSVYKASAYLWDGFYQHFIRQATRKMNLGDQLFKRIHVSARLHASLKNHAIHVLGMEDPALIQKYILDHKKGLMLPNGEVFSEKNLKMNIYSRLGARVDSSTGLPLWQGDDLTAEAKRMFENERHLLDENGNIRLTSSQRENLAAKSLDWANEATFTEELGKVDKEVFGKKGISSDISAFAGRNDHMLSSLLRSLAPFYRTPVNLWRDSLAHTPVLGMLHRKNIADWQSTDPARRSKVIGRQMVGSALWTLGGMAVFSGKITGGLSKDKRRREMQQRAGLRPYTIIKPNGELLDLSRLEPLSMPVKWMADFYETAQFVRNDEKEEGLIKDYGAILTGATADAISGSTYTKGLAEGMMLFVTAANSEDMETWDALEAWAKHRAGSMVPNFLEIGNVDDLQRDVRSFKDHVLKKVWPYGIPPKRDPIFGRIVKQHQAYPNPHIKSITPIKVYTQENSPEIYSELLSLHGMAGAPSIKYRGNPNLPMTQYHANFEFISVDPKTGVESVNLKKSKQLKAYAKNFKAKGGAPCPIAEGQDFYDFLQQYGSVRKVKIDAPQILAWRENTPQEFSKEDKENWNKFMDEFENKLGRSEVNLEELIMVALRSDFYRNIPKKHYPELRLKTYRVEFLTSMIHNWRRDCIDELSGITRENKEGLIRINTDDMRADPKMTHGGPLGLLWPELAFQAAAMRPQAIQRKNRNAVTPETLLQRQENELNPPKE